MTEKISRDAERSKEAILEAAEKLFAQKGYENTSLQEIGQVAGVSRGTPNYFFGTKEQLYQIVLERVLHEENKVLGELAAKLSRITDLETIVTEVVNVYMDFLVAHPHFIELLEREALSDKQYLNKDSLLAVSETGIAMIRQIAKTDEQTAIQFLLSLVALCWYPLAHARTFANTLNLNPYDPAFVAERKRHIISFLLTYLKNDG
jgi:TetR/AcrR family transcriptional regulator